MLNSETDFDLMIESIAFGGDGVARLDGKIVFIPYTLPGEKVRARLIKEKNDHAVAQLLTILKPSTERIDPLPGFVLPQATPNSHLMAYSPGYCYFYTNYANELKIKQDQFSLLLQKIPGFNVKKQLLKPIGSPKNLNYRNKITLHFQNDHGERKLGYFMADNVTILDLPACPLADSAINEELQKQRQKPGFLHTLQPGMSLTLRYTETNGVTLWRNAPSKKLSWLREKTPNGLFSTPPGSFFQVNPGAAFKLVEEVQSWLSQLETEVFIDLYCGTGLFAISAASIPNPPSQIIGIDIDQDAIDAAQFNAKQYQVSNCRFIAGPASRLLNSDIAALNGRCTLLIDPPRTGLDFKTMNEIGSLLPQNIIYVSCSPDTLVRDLQKLERKGYQLVKTRLIDMFPRTPHFESISLLQHQ